MTLTAMRELFKDDKIWCLAARVALHDGETVHYEVTPEGAMSVSVRTHMHDVQINALLKGGGIWYIPDVGTEVMIAFDNGEFEGDAYIMNPYGDSPAGLAPGKLFLLADIIEARSADGTAIKLPTWADFNALQDKVNAFILKYNSHTHVAPVVGTTAVTPAVETIVAPPTGTTKMKAE